MLYRPFTGRLALLRFWCLGVGESERPLSLQQRTFSNAKDEAHFCSVGGGEKNTLEVERRNKNTIRARAVCSFYIVLNLVKLFSFQVFFSFQFVLGRQY